MTIPLIVLGFSGIIAQIILLRELFIVFAGNELSIGIVLANWLILEAAGSLFGRRIDIKRRKVAAYVAAQLLFCTALPLCIWYTRILKSIVNVVPGEGIGIGIIMPSSLLILLPPSFIHGALFTFGCSITAEHSGRSAQSVGRVYLYEIIGTAAGGSLLTYFLLSRLHIFRIVFVLICLNSLICLYLMRRPTAAVQGRFILVFCSILFAAGALFTVLTRYDDELQHRSIQRQWRKEEILFYSNSRYGNIAVTGQGEQRSIYSDGIPFMTIPVSDIEWVENIVHFPLLTHPGPERIIIISGGAGGLIGEALKHPVKHCDYVELDPLILQTVERFSTPDLKRVLNDPRVSITHADGRRFLHAEKDKYDVIFVGLSDPGDLQQNRLFTEEFFTLAHDRLNEGGLLVVSASGSMSYLNAELRKLNACILNTLKAVFPTVLIIPGNSNLFLSIRDGGENIQLDPDLLKRRLIERRIDARLVTPYYIDYRLENRRLDWFLASMAGTEARINRDFQPAGILYSMSLWHAMFSPRAARFLHLLASAQLKTMLLVLGSILVAFAVSGALLKQRAFGAAIPLSLFTTGFAGMIFDLILIFSFQVLHGYVFFLIGTLITAFMAGSAAGSWIATSRLERIARTRMVFIIFEGCVILFSLILAAPALISSGPATGLCNRMSVLLGMGELPQLYFPLLCFAGGFLVGFEFPLANRMHIVTSSGAGRSAGLLYASDLLGGFVGGLLGAVLLLPAMGLTGACAAVTMIKTATLVLFVLASRGRSLQEYRAP
jgi:spermidine synthase